MISQETFEIVRDNAEALDSAIIYNRDFSFNLYVHPFVYTTTHISRYPALASRPLSDPTFSGSTVV
jgi:hypothetical protein